MGYIRDRHEELTGFQEGAAFRKSFDLGCDFVMVYGTDDTMPRRVQEYREQGYVVHLMTGISWGQYQDYLDGKWDGREHWDEAQTDRNGRQIIHNPTVPYMVPTISFTNYLTERLKIAIDSGVEALHLEEPEFWNHGGYSPAFKREFEIYYHEPWVSPHSNLDARYKTSKLMAYLYTRAIDRISSALKEYAMVRYEKNIPFYVPTHSLLNYTQWKIMSPEATLIDIPTVDGCIAQIWTGTSRTGNVHAGKYRERTFETAYLEYGIMQELVRDTGRRMWFLHDPIEDRPQYRWENYRYNYLKTVVASFLHPEVYRYEICPWPHRVFEGVYPRIQPNIAEKDESSIPAPDAEGIPADYASLLSGVMQLCGDMKQSEYSFEGFSQEIGIFMSDSGLFQRSFPDGVAEEGFADALHNSAVEVSEGPYTRDDAAVAEMMESVLSDEKKCLDYVQSGAFPQFYSLALPLLKYGLPVRPVQLDNISRYTSYLANYSFLILSYEFMKPASPDINVSIAAWVRSGGILIYIGDGSDPFHQIGGFWKTAGYLNPAQHLFEACGLPFSVTEGSFDVGDGHVAICPVTPAKISATPNMTDSYRNMVKDVLTRRGVKWHYKNDLTLRRGPYIISAVMDESVTKHSKVFSGLFVDLLQPEYPVITKKEVLPDGNAVLFDLSKIESEDVRIIGTGARVHSLEAKETGFQMQAKAADRIQVSIRLRLPKKPRQLAAEDGTVLEWSWDENSRTAYIHYTSRNQLVNITGEL